MLTLRNHRLGGFFFCYLVLFSTMAAPIANAEKKDIWDGTPATLTQVSVQVQLDRPDKFDWSGLAKDLIGLYLKPGEIITRDKLASSRKALAPFGEVAANVAVSGRSVVATFLLKPYTRIKTIAIHGNYPIFEREVRNALGVASGDFFRPQEMPQQEERIAQLYKSQGFIDPSVKITWQSEKKTGLERLQVTINEGAYYHLSKVTLAGNRVMADAVILGKLSVWRKSLLWVGAARFEPLELKKDIEKLTRFYRKHGFYDAVINSEITYNKNWEQARVALTIDEGPEYKVSFSGNQAFMDCRLERNLVLEEVGNIGNKGLRRSIQAIRRRYLKAGYADVKVHWQEEAPIPDGAVDSGRRNIVIKIEEGARSIVEAVRIEGNSALDTATIKDQILTRPSSGFHRGVFSKTVLEEDIAAVRALYLEHGFLSTTVERDVHTDPESHRVTVVLKIVEGVQTLVGRTAIRDGKGGMPVSAEVLEKVLTMKKGDPYRPYQLQEEENNLSAKIAPQGYPHVQVHGAAQLSEDQTHADLTYTIDSGPYVTIGDLFVTGNFRTKAKFIKHEMGLTTGEAFKLRQVLEGQRDLRNLQVFDSVQVNSIGLKEEAATVPLLVTVAEKKPFFFELGGGYQSDKGFYGRTKVGDNNLGGTAKDLWLGTEISQVGYRWDLGFGEPRLFGSRIKLDAALYTERSEPFNQDFGTDTMGGSVNLSRSWTPHFTTNVGLRYERRQQYLRNSDTVVEDPTLYESRSAVIVTPAINFDDRDSFIRPRKGWLAFCAVDIFKGVDNELDDFFKYRFDVRRFQPLSERWVLAARIGAGYLHTYGSTDVLPQDQLFYLGGTTTVRGFGENLLKFDQSHNAVGGVLSIMGSIEGRFSLGSNWETVLFVDTGHLSQDNSEIGRYDFRWSAGLGLAYMTPVGPVGLYYGRKLNQREGESPGQWHFSIGYTF